MCKCLDRFTRAEFDEHLRAYGTAPCGSGMAGILDCFRANLDEVGARLENSVPDPEVCGRGPGGAPVAVEKRAAQRKKTEAAGRLSSAGSTEAWDCSILDISEHGARVSVIGVSEIPRRVELLHMKTGRLHDAELVWRRGDLAGLAFHRADEDVVWSETHARRA